MCMPRGCRRLRREPAAARATSGIPPSSTSISASLGFADPSLDDPEQATIVCARTGLGDLPIDVGYLAHHVRRTAGGSEMRSRFWIGGPYAAGRNSALGTVMAQAARLLMRPSETDARALLVHCAEEMQHLARFLPALYAEFRLRD